MVAVLVRKEGVDLAVEDDSLSLLGKTPILSRSKKSQNFLESRTPIQ